MNIAWHHGFLRISVNSFDNSASCSCRSQEKLLFTFRLPAALPCRFCLGDKIVHEFPCPLALIFFAIRTLSSLFFPITSLHALRDPPSQQWSLLVERAGSGHVCLKMPANRLGFKSSQSMR